MHFAELFLLRNPQSFKDALVAAHLEAALQHAHVQRLSEATGMSKQIGLTPSLK